MRLTAAQQAKVNNTPHTSSDGVNAGSLAYQRVKAKLQPVAARKSISTPNTTWDNTNADVLGDLAKFAEKTRAETGMFPQSPAGGLKFEYEMDPIRLRVYHDSRGAHTYVTAWTTCYGMTMPVIRIMNFFPAPPKPKARDKRRRWNDDD